MKINSIELSKTLQGLMILVLLMGEGSVMSSAWGHTRATRELEEQLAENLDFSDVLDSEIKQNQLTEVPPIVAPMEAPLEEPVQSFFPPPSAPAPRVSQPSTVRSSELAKPGGKPASSSVKTDPGQGIDEEAPSPSRFKSAHSCELEPARYSGKKDFKSPRHRSARRGLVLKDESPESAFECVHHWAEKAEEAFAGKCHGKVTSELMMCIFLREQRGNLTMNACPQWGCGMAQMTGDGARGVRNGLLKRPYRLLPQYQAFFRSIGRPDLANENPHSIDRTDALDMQQSVGMTATLLCAINIDGARDQAKMAERYNGNYRHPEIVYPYRKFAVQCLNDFKDGSVNEFTRKGILISERSSRISHRNRHSKHHRHSRRSHR